MIQVADETAMDYLAISMRARIIINFRNRHTLRIEPFDPVIGWLRFHHITHHTVHLITARGALRDGFKTVIHFPLRLAESTADPRPKSVIMANYTDILAVSTNHRRLAFVCVDFVLVSGNPVARYADAVKKLEMRHVTSITCNRST